MNIKRLIQIILRSNVISIFGLLVIIISLVFKAKSSELQVLSVCLAIPFLLAYFSRKMIIKRYLRNGKYPGAFYAVLDKYGLIADLGIMLPDELHNKIDRPDIDSTQFIKDNKLKTEIGKNRILIRMNAFVILSGFIMLLLCAHRFSFHKFPHMYIGITIFILINVYSWLKGEKQYNDLEPLVKFTGNGLILSEQQLNWKDIYDWEFFEDNEDKRADIVIYYYNNDREKREALAGLQQLNINKIDFLLLMYHFKEKYGRG